MPNRAVTASKFVMETLASAPSPEWKVSDFVQKSGDCRTEANFYNTLTRLHARGKVKPTNDGRNVWFSISG